MREIKSGRNLLFIFMGIIIILIVIIAAPFVYQGYKENVFNPTNDTDGDKVPDDRDAFPNDPNEWKDSDNDGIGDNADSDDDNDGILDGQDYIPYNNSAIRVEINRIRLNDPPPYKPFATTAIVIAKVTIDDKTYVLPNETGEEIPIDQDMTVNWTLKQDVPDDIGYYSIKLALYYKISVSESIIDVNGDKNERSDEGRTLTINYYLGNQIGHQYPSDRELAFSDGFDDGNKGLFDEKDAQIWYRIVTIDENDNYY